ncbi:MAG: T9SS type A sorting domain-containing protein [Lewinellaceae bacterium]|nr:T9SS type A sorting domain-containing protein [Lewinellaceae bacterium]
MVVITTVGTETPEWLEHFSLYPNPNAGAFHVEMTGRPQEEVEFALYDALGRLVRRDVADFGSGSLNRLLDYGQLSAAVYQLHIRAGDTAMVVKIVVQH